MTYIYNVIHLSTCALDFSNYRPLIVQSMTDSMTRSPSSTTQHDLNDDSGGARFIIPTEENQQIVTEVNEYLSRAIDARNIEQLKNENIHPLTLKFKDRELERKVKTHAYSMFVHISSY